MSHHPSIDFSRPIPIFPLPNCVLFPGVVQPLHLFEDRYKHLMAATLADQSLMAMALLKPGWEKNYHAAADIHPMVCIGKIIAHEKVDDGKYNLLLQGVTRARVRQEHLTPERFREAMLEEIHIAKLPADQRTLCRKLISELFTISDLADLTVADSVRELVEKEVAPETIVDVLAFTLVQDPTAKQRLLEQLNPLKRMEDLILQLQNVAQNSKPPPKRTSEEWPPKMTGN